MNVWLPSVEKNLM